MNITIWNFGTSRMFGAGSKALIVGMAMIEASAQVWRPVTARRAVCKILGLYLSWCEHFQRVENLDKEHQLGGNEQGKSMLFFPKSKQRPERELSIGPDARTWHCGCWNYKQTLMGVGERWNLTSIHSVTEADRQEGPKVRWELQLQLRRRCTHARPATRQ